MSLPLEVAMQRQAVREKTDETGPIPMVAAVDGVDDDGASWKEVGDVFSYSSTGVGFYLPRPCRVGNLVSLKLQLPHHLRCYGHDEELYRVWGLVQSCFMSISPELAAYQVVTALAGKEPPESYTGNPLQNYRICGSSEDGLWKITESETRFVQRRDVRYWEKIDVYLALVDGRGSTIGGEKTHTENISTSGAAVVTTLDLKVGDRMKLISEEFDFSGLAVVCNTRPLQGVHSTLNIQFVDSKFPVQKLKLQTINE